MFVLFAPLAPLAAVALVAFSAAAAGPDAAQPVKLTLDVDPAFVNKFLEPKPEAAKPGVAPGPKPTAAVRVTDPASVTQEDKQALVQKVVDAALKVKGVATVNASVGITNEWKYFASSEGSYIEQETWETSPSASVLRTSRFRASYPYCCTAG